MLKFPAKSIKFYSNNVSHPPIKTNAERAAGLSFGACDRLSDNVSLKNLYTHNISKLHVVSFYVLVAKMRLL